MEVYMAYLEMESKRLGSFCSILKFGRFYFSDAECPKYNPDEK